MAAVSITILDSYDQSNAILPLHLQSSSYGDLNLAQCLKVKESGQYSFLVRINLPELNDQLLEYQEQELNLGQDTSHSLTATSKASTARVSPASSAQGRESASAANTTAASIDSNDSTTSGGESNMQLREFITNESVQAAARRELGIESAEDQAASQTLRDASSDAMDDADSYYASHAEDEVLSLVGFNGQFKRIQTIQLFINDDYKGYFSYDTYADSNDVIIGKFVYNSNSASANEVKKPFLMQYDAVKLHLQLTFEDDQQLSLYSDYLLCTCTADNNRNIARILEELSALNDSKILDLMFMQSHLEENYESNIINEHRTYQSLNSYINLISDVIDCYQKQYNAFMATGRHVLVKGYELQRIESVRSVTHKSHQWLMHHPEVLNEAESSPYAIKINGRKYLPSRMQGEVTKKNFDTPENRSVIGFIRTVMLNAEKVLNEYSSLLHEQQRLTGSIASENEEQAQAPIVALKGIQIKIFRTQLQKLRAQTETLKLIYLSYAKIFGIRDAVLQSRPLKSKVFREIKPYAAVFRSIMKYYNYGDFNARKDVLLFKVTRLDKLFEYYCLYRLLGMLLNNGFKPVERKDPVTFHYQSCHNYVSYDDPVANTFYLERGKQRITLYYQPVISNYRFENGIRAFRTTSNYVNQAIGSSFTFYTPDFMLKVSSGNNMAGDDDYLIFDSKFSNAHSIKRYYLADLQQKYANEVAIAVLKRRNDPSAYYPEQESENTPHSTEHVLPATDAAKLQEPASASSNEATANAVDPSAAATATATKAASANATASADSQPHNGERTSTSSPASSPAQRGKDTRNLNGSIHDVDADGYHYERGNAGADFKHTIENFELVRVKAPKMVFALQGRVIVDQEDKEKRAELLENPALAADKLKDPTNRPRTPNPRGNYSSSKPHGKGGPDTAYATRERHVELFHSGPLALHFRPVTTVGLVEISTRIDTMPELWQEIVHVLPYLKQS